MELKFIKIIKEVGIAHLILSRPEVMNSLNFEMINEIYTVVCTLNEDKDIRVLIISGIEGNFAAGADILPMIEMKQEKARKSTFNKAYNAIENLEIPVIAAISGYALGGGLELALACDIRICSADATMGLPEIKLGIFPGAGGTQRLPKIIGAGRAKEMIFLGKPINANKALEFGLCNILSEGDPVEEAFVLADKLIKLSRTALAGAKRTVNFGLGRELHAGIKYEEEIWSSCFSTKDQFEGMSAFIEKRKPFFTGE